MAWERLRTDYKDAVWPGMKRYVQIDNGDNTISLKDVTVYTVYDESFFGALDANRIGAAVNAIMAALEDGTDLYEAFEEFFEEQKKAFKDKGNMDLESFRVFLDGLRAAANADVTQIKKDYAEDIEAFEDKQESIFNIWFENVKGQLGSDPAGKLQIEIDDLVAHIHNLAVKVHIVDTVGTAAAVVMRNETTGTKYRITDFSKPLYLTEAGEYSLNSENASYFIAPNSATISNADLMTHMTFKIRDGSGLAFVNGCVGSYANK